MAIFRVKNLNKSYFTRKEWFSGPPKKIFPLREVSFDLKEKESLGIAGESGSGKSTLVKILAGLEKADSGQIEFDGMLLSFKKDKRVESYFRKNLQVIFQDPYEALNPKHRVEEILREVLRAKERLTKTKISPTQAKEEMVAQLQALGLGAEHLPLYSFHLSGGQRQRLAIAQALIMNPKILLADEPFSALDVSVQAQVLNHFLDLKKKTGLTFVVVSHDLAILKYLTDKIIVYYGGRILEIVKAEDLTWGAHHPYTTMLLDAAKKEKTSSHISWQAQENPLEFEGCPYYFRCPFRMEQCKIMPELRETPHGKIACHFVPQR